MDSIGFSLVKLLDVSVQKHITTMRTDLVAQLNSKNAGTHVKLIDSRRLELLKDILGRKLDNLSLSNLDTISLDWMDCCIHLEKFQEMWESDIGYPHVLDDTEEELEELIDYARVYTTVPVDPRIPGQPLVYSYAVAILMRILQRAGLDEFVRR